MKPVFSHIVSLAPLLLVGLFAASTAPAAPRVEMLRVPDGGVQPQTVVDSKGIAHIIYLKGDPGACDVFYVRKQGDQPLTAPLRVNTQPGCAIAMGTIRGAQLALGKGGRVHVAWNGSGKDAPKSPQGYRLTPFNYTRLNDAGTAFEPERNLMTSTTLLDGGGTVAADAQGHVYAMWHGIKTGSTPGEANRAVWVAISSDDGKTFAPEKQANPQPTGACACCGMKAFTDSSGNLFALYRTATQTINRDMALLTSRDHGATFTAATLDRWRIGQCVMSSESFSETARGLITAFESNGRVELMQMPPAGGEMQRITPSSANRAKYPSVATNSKGETLVAWAEGTAWQKGGALAWQVFDAAGKPLGEASRADNGVPVWSLPASFARADGSFVILH
ncbi:MAG: exo-alpha-sialidase [Verrucomicrobia bacterium]|nr:exo-alpha-sialidase [Verrucomicrobiota bacterium]